MLQVFKVAKIMAPSVIYIDELEKVFVSDKKRAKEYALTEPVGRIKKELLKVEILVHATHAAFKRNRTAQERFHHWQLTRVEEKRSR